VTKIQFEIKLPSSVALKMYETTIFRLKNISDFGKETKLPVIGWGTGALSTFLLLKQLVALIVQNVLIIN